MPTEADFEAALTADPNDTSCRAIYADWLEEQGRPLDAEGQRLKAEMKTGWKNPALRRANADWLEKQGKSFEAVRERSIAATLEYKQAIGPGGRGFIRCHAPSWDAFGVGSTVVPHDEAYLWRPRWAWDELGFLPAEQLPDGEACPPWLVKIKPRVWVKLLRLAGIGRRQRASYPATRENMLACRDALLSRGEPKEAKRLSMGLVTQEGQAAVLEEYDRLYRVKTELFRQYLTLLAERNPALYHHLHGA